MSQVDWRRQQLVPKCFSCDCSTDSFSCSERKNRKKTRLKQGRKSRKENQNVVVVANPHGSSPLCCRTAIALLSLHCCTAISPLLFRCCSAAVAPLSRCCHTAITPVLLHCLSAAVAPAVATQLHRYLSIVAPLSNRCCSCRERV